MKVNIAGATSIGNDLEQFALPCAREERISLVKILFTTRQVLQTNSKDFLVDCQHANVDRCGDIQDGSGR
ncbi:hypothetical protein Mal48_41530 [Thalassoglobus polymorphus]|uniref:Uncharacterized protein n=1 Tax=Thalassoglobus polymorphus TaxID=2527994 RepID=A0A517QTB5_9PLAN|nr:hypothetical protein Mal48_41530 [Thalassoglobus polymorphus]